MEEGLGEEYELYAYWRLEEEERCVEKFGERVYDMLVGLREIHEGFDGWATPARSGPKPLDMDQESVTRIVEEGDIWAGKNPERTGEKFELSFVRYVGDDDRRVLLSLSLGQDSPRGLSMSLEFSRGVEASEGVLDEGVAAEVLELIADIWNPKWSCWTTFEYFKRVKDAGCDELRLGWLTYLATTEDEEAVSEAVERLRGAFEVREAPGGVIVKAADHVLLGGSEDDVELGKKLYEMLTDERGAFVALAS